MNPHRRREFLRRTAAAACAAGVGGCGLQGLLPAAAQAARRLGTCGPPPRKSPERQTSAEGMPPLPLPVTPLRRSEPKAEPAPPLM
ncbi:MAG: twin-arginine translocation signal domain-containing protein, partial [Pirellulales bacterium]|nr:twin-arginine translocation signal domain-containing protein [Pirellulales bacterium]